jgi:outer membrane protein assembly factor BamB
MSMMSCPNLTNTLGIPRSLGIKRAEQSSVTCSADERKEEIFMNKQHSPLVWSGSRRLVLTPLAVLVATLSMLGMLSVRPQVAHAAGEALTLSPTGVYPGQTITVTGSGYPSSSSVRLYVDYPSGRVVYSASSDNNGGFTVAVPISSDEAAATYTMETLVIGPDGPLLGTSKASFQVLPWLSWSNFGDDSQNDRDNTQETQLSSSTVGSLQNTWKVAPGGDISSSAVVVNNMLYVGTRGNNVYALNASTGSTIWSFATGSPIDATPAVANGIVYVGDEKGTIFALNANLVYDLANPSASGGSMIWSYPTGAAVLSSPTVVGGVVYVGSDDMNIYALNASTGAKLWSFTTDGAVEDSPAVVGGVVYVDTPYSVYALNASTGALVWHISATAGVLNTSLVVADGAIYIAGDDQNSGGRVWSLDPGTGATLWSVGIGGLIDGSSYANSALAVVNNVLYVGTEDHRLYALYAYNGVKLWSFVTGGAIEDAPAVANGVVYVASNDHSLYALNANTGVKLWSFATHSTVASSPTVIDGSVYVGSDDDNLYAFSAFPFTQS